MREWIGEMDQKFERFLKLGNVKKLGETVAIMIHQAAPIDLERRAALMADIRAWSPAMADRMEKSTTGPQYDPAVRTMLRAQLRVWEGRIARRVVLDGAKDATQPLPPPTAPPPQRPTALASGLTPVEPAFRFRIPEAP